MHLTPSVHTRDLQEFLSPPSHGALPTFVLTAVFWSLPEVLTWILSRMWCISSHLRGYQQYTV